MPTNKLTDSQCKAAKPREKAYKLFDGDGLHLLVTPAGGKIWRLAYRLDGKPKTKSYGPYPEVSLAGARELRDNDKRTLHAGDDPMAARKAGKPKKTLLFKDACPMYWATRQDLSDSYLHNITRALDRHLYPGLGNLDVREINRSLLLKELLKMDAKGLFNYVRKTRIWVSEMYDWLVENEKAEINPAALIDPRKAFGHKDVEHFPALELNEIPSFWKRLNAENDIQSVMACKLLAYTWVRTNELRSCIPGKEIDGDLWRIPRGTMKNRKPHLVPLPRQAVEIINQLLARRHGEKYLVEAEHTTERPMSENTILALINRIGYKGRMTGHGWRTVGSTWANENGYNRDAIERQLSHVPGDRTRASYNRAEYLDERRQMLQDWADWLDSCEVNASRSKRR